MKKPSVSIVVVDDHSLFRAGVVQYLEEDASISVVAQGATGEEAIALCSTYKPTVALVDISMPGGGGIAAVRQIKIDSPLTKSVMLTVSENEDDVLRALEAGAAGYILKGASGSELVTILKAVANGETWVSPNLSAKMLATMANHGGQRPLDRLTPKETLTLELVSRGLNNRECAQALNVAEKTVKYHVTNIMKKLKVRNRLEAALIAQRSWGHRLPK